MSRVIHHYPVTFRSTHQVPAGSRILCVLQRPEGPAVYVDKPESDLPVASLVVGSVVTGAPHPFKPDQYVGSAIDAGGFVVHVYAVIQ